MGRPGLVGTMARTAVIAGTATATSNAVNRRQVARAQERAEAEAYREQQYAAPPAAAPAPAPVAPAPAAAAGDDLVAKIAQLGELHQQGILSDEEFAAAKQKLLG
ncbi:SHOCT domain-containing protein [Nocardioides mangrovi]|uniref:SHOCT domain-containing protein n=1 Tax=Nocardioides mangrovi TaxID=2874580 RepID=A0ABS7UB77_9ACTN|nr:SHOCT domain-containing protein [Nocardioides mangrovi]MBZ5738243.1 SHOCT domain-containing protein [Nocardioides mangrovi]